MLSIMCITRLEEHCWPFLQHLAEVAAECDNAELILGIDSKDQPDIEKTLFNRLQDYPQLDSHLDGVVTVCSRGYVESVLEEVLEHCRGDYVLRMDDDEKCSPAMRAWLKSRAYEKKSHWKFCTANLWGNAQSILTNPPLWPDHHTRLSIRGMAGGRTTPHAGSPHGGGELAPVIHEHHKFLVKSLEQRREVAARYDAFQQGYGTGDGLRPFSLPETCYDKFHLAPLGDGTVREWNADELWSLDVPRAKK